MPRADYRFSFQKRVRYAECDPQGIVFNSRYLEYLDIGITEYWRTTGVHAQSASGIGPEVHVVRNLVEYRKPVLFDERIDICVRCRSIGNTSFVLDYEIHGEIHGAGADDLRAQGDQVVVHVAEAQGRPSAVPDWLVRCFEAYEGRTLKAGQVAA